MSNPILPARVTIADHVLFQEIAGESVLLNMASEHYFGLDDVGTQIWRLLVEDGVPAKVLLQLQQIYDVDEATLQVDLVKLLEQLSTEGLIKLES